MITMRRIFCLIILLTVVHVAYAQQITTVKFDEIEHDFGDVEETKGDVYTTFEYKNTGDKPFVIFSVNTTCGCTTPVFSRQPLMPGKSETMKIGFDPVNQYGVTKKSIFIRANVYGGTVELTISANVTPRPKTLEDFYPVLLSNGVRMQDLEANFGNSPRTKTATRILKIVNTSDKIVNVTASKPLDKWLTAYVEKTELKPDETTNFVFKITPAGLNLWGEYTADLPVFVNGKEQYYMAQVRTVFTEDFSKLTATERRNAPKATINSKFYHFSTVQYNKELQHSFYIKNKGKSPLIIRHIDAEKFVTTQLSDKTVQPGEVTKLTVKLLSDDLSTIAQMVRIITNDPANPILEIRILANVK